MCDVVGVLKAVYCVDILIRPFVKSFSNAFNLDILDFMT